MAKAGSLSDLKKQKFPLMATAIGIGTVGGEPGFDRHIHHLVRFKPITARSQ